MLNKIIFENIKNSKVILRSDLNESVDKNNNLTNTKRLEASIKTIQELLARKNKIIVLSHRSEKDTSLAPMANYLSKIFNNLIFIQSTNLNEIKNYIKKYDSDLYLLENTRNFGDGWDENKNEDFAKELALLGEYFVFDAFSVAHRDHATTTLISKFLPHALGPCAKKEKEILENVLQSTKKQLIILGGAKLSTKLPIVERFLKNNHEVFLGGAMIHPILKAKGVDIKNSFTENIDISNIINNSNLYIPTDYIWNKENEKIVDIGENSLEFLKEKINAFENILWNGPFGLYEEGYVSGTNKIVEYLNNQKNKKVIVGGGDTLSVLENFPDFNCFYISLSGGAMLDYLSGKKLPGIEANI